MADLKPCPCCEGAAKLKSTRWESDAFVASRTTYTVRCTKCGLSTASCYDAPEAAALWNRRVEVAGSSMTVAQLMEQAHNTAVSKGWWDEERNVAEQIALQHSELSEVLEEWRDGHDLVEVYHEGEKPCGIPIEYADLLIRVFDTCQQYGIDLEVALKIKMMYNTMRPYRHGGKRA